MPLQHVHNFRDLGGYPASDGRTTRWRTLFRADGLHRLSTADVETLRDFGLATVIDLRTHDELVQRGRFPLDDHPADFHHLPILDAIWSEEDLQRLGENPAELMLQLYLDMCRQGGAEIASVLRILAEPSALPAVFHCAAGKDRTGIVSAVVLGVLGVPADFIAADYALSEPAMDRMLAWYRVHHPDIVEKMAQLGPTLRAARPATMEALLHLIDQRHGSMRGYVRALGVSNATIAALTENLLEP